MDVDDDSVARAYRIVSVFMDAERRRKEPPLHEVCQRGIDRMMERWWGERTGIARAYAGGDFVEIVHIEPRDFYAVD